jgi:hypothetical protein
MLIKHHLLFSLILAAALYPVFSTSVWILVAAGVLVDIDHYFIYIKKFKNFSLRKAHKFFMQAEECSEFYPMFHLIEFVAILFALSFFFEFALIALIGAVGHLALDFAGERIIRNTGRNFSTLSLLRGKRQI